MSPAYYNKMIRQAERLQGVHKSNVVTISVLDCSDINHVGNILRENGFSFEYFADGWYFEVEVKEGDSLERVSGQLWYRLNGFRFVMKHNQQ